MAGEGWLNIDSGRKRSLGKQTRESTAKQHVDVDVAVYEDDEQSSLLQIEQQFEH